MRGDSQGPRRLKQKHSTLRSKSEAWFIPRKHLSAVTTSNRFYKVHTIPVDKRPNEAGNRLNGFTFSPPTSGHRAKAAVLMKVIGSSNCTSTPDFGRLPA